MSEANPADRIVSHVDSGGQISGRGQYLYRVNPGEYFLCCDMPGCCDTWMNTDDFLNYVGDGSDFGCIASD